VSTCAEVLAKTLRDAGVTRMFGLPGGEILQFIDAARAAGIQFVLTRHEAHAAFMADVTGQLTGIPGVCVSTLGPGAVNMTLGVANAFLDRSPVVAVTAAHARAAAPFATHQHLDLCGLYRPITKASCMLDGVSTTVIARQAIQLAITPRAGPVHIALPSDVAGQQDRETPATFAPDPDWRSARASSETIEQVSREIRRARRPVVILGIDLHPDRDALVVREFVDRMRAPVFVTPKAKGIIPEDHDLFCGVCAGVSADAEVLRFLERADLLIGIGFDPVESDKLWHHTMRLVSVGPVSIAAEDFRPIAECTGDVEHSLREIVARGLGSCDWTREDIDGVRTEIDAALRPTHMLAGLSGCEMTRRLRELFPRETIFATDVGSVKMVTTQAWRCYEPQTFLVSNGLSAMGYSVPAAIAACLRDRDRPVLSTVGDGGFAMTIGEIETCVRERLSPTIVVFNDSSLSLIDVAQQRRGYPSNGVRFAPVDFAMAARALGAWARRVRHMDELVAACREAPRRAGPVVIDAVIDPTEYLRQTVGHHAAKAYRT
jgi:acetolactate synthase-1/2/3 large subunit